MHRGSVRLTLFAQVTYVNSVIMPDDDEDEASTDSSGNTEHTELD
jgi:hypothetical protein